MKKKIQDFNKLQTLHWECDIIINEVLSLHKPPHNAFPKLNEWIKVDQNELNWKEQTKLDWMDQSGLNQTKMGRNWANGPKWIVVDRNIPKWT